MHWFREPWLLFLLNSSHGIFGLKSCQYEIGTFLGYTQVPNNLGNGFRLGTPKSVCELLHSSKVGAVPKLLGAGAKSCTDPGCKEIFQVCGSLLLHLLGESRRRSGAESGGGMKTSSVHLCLWSWTEASLRRLKLWFWIKGCVITWEMCEKISC